ncbi:MAG: hypothetical protein ACLFM7_12865 [Bacteroidales bacterium]
MENKRYFILRFRCRNKAMLFRREDDFLTFLRIYEKRMRPFVATYAWSFTAERALFLAATRQEDNRYIKKAGELVKRYQRYHRKRNRGRSNAEKKVIHLPGPDKETLRDTVVRVHCRPLLEGLGHDFAEYPWTSYLLLLGEKHPWLQTGEVMGWFGGKEAFRSHHHRFLINHIGKQESERENFVTFIQRKE